MSNSSLVNYTRISPNKNSPRNHVIDTITIHCYVGQVTVEDMASWLCNPAAKASCNYGIGSDGRVAMIVEEKDRSWCSSNSANDNRAITIECACDKTHPYAINDTVYSKLIELCTDICRRNNIKELKWRADKSLIGHPEQQNMTVHRWFANKACPGDYIYSRLGQIATAVNERLGSTAKPVTTALPHPPFQVRVKIPDLNYRSEPSMSGKVLGVTGKGTFGITAISNDGWGHLKSEAGWIWLKNPEYCEIIGANEKADSKFQVCIGTNTLRIRKGPGTDTEWTGAYTGVGTFTITETSPGKGSVQGWGKLMSGAGWISLDYARKV